MEVVIFAPEMGCLVTDLSEGVSADSKVTFCSAILANTSKATTAGDGAEHECSTNVMVLAGWLVRLCITIQRLLLLLR
jgi:hypothetical protein